jgi:flagellin
MADNDVTRIAGNIGAMNALYALTNINKQLSIHQTRLATGKRINSAADDPAGLAISTKMNARSEGLKVALSNIGDAKNLLAVAESGLGRLNDILSSMRTIAENAANDTNGTDERAIDKEQLASYAQQINDIVDQTKWSDKKLISGDYNAQSAALTFQTGADFGETTTLYGLQDMHAAALQLLNNATAAVAATVNVSSIGTSYTATLATPTNASAELASGGYTMKTVVSGNSTAGYTYSAQLINSLGSNVGAAVTGTYSASAGATIALGNGLTFALASGMVGVDPANAKISTTAVGTGMTASLSALASGGVELASGTYSVNVTIAGTTGAFTYSAQLVDALGCNVGTAATGTYSAGSGSTVDFGNGLSVDLASGKGKGTITGTKFDYTHSVAQSAKTTTSGTVTYAHSKAAVAASVDISETGGVSDANDFAAYMKKIDDAMVVVNSQLSKIGSMTGSLTFKEDQVSSSQINIEASYNRIMNANMAEEQVNASKLMILQQTSTAMLAQANAAPQFLLSLFK